MASSAKRTAAPLTPGQQYARSQQQAQMLRMAVLGIVMLLVALPLIPSPLLGVTWLPLLTPVLSPLLTEMPPSPLDLGIISIGVFPIWRWLYWGLAGGLAFFARTLVLHLVLIYAQRTRPLQQERTYMRIAFPASAPAAIKDGPNLLRSFHGMTAPVTPRNPQVAPIMLCWTGRPEQRIQQGVSLTGTPAFRTTLQRAIEAVSPGTQVQTWDDPLLEACKPGRMLAIAVMTATAGTTLPIAPLGASPVVQEALLTALKPQAGVAATSVRLALEPIPDRQWRRDVMAMLERAKPEAAGTDEQQALKAKAAGPAFRSGISVYVIADTAEAASMQLQTITGAFAGTLQSFGFATQRLVVQQSVIVPAVPRPPAPLPRLWALVAALSGVLVLAGAAVGSISGLMPLTALTATLSGLLAAVPMLAVRAFWRASTRADQWMVPTAALRGLLHPQNPRVIPVFWPWFGYRT